MSDRFEDESRQRMPTEGVRILGAEEAQAALGARRGAPDEPAAGSDDDAADDDATDDHRAASSTSTPTPRSSRTSADRFPDEGPTWSATAANDEPVDRGSAVG